MTPEDCTGTFREYFGPTDGPVPDDATLIVCDGCGELSMVRRGERIILRPGRS